MAEKNLTTYEDILSSYQTTIVVTDAGETFEIKALSPGDFVLAIGSPLIRSLTPEGLDLAGDTEEAIRKSVAEMPLEKMIDLLSDKAFLESVNSIICASVTSVNFIDKPQSECDTAQKELSVHLLTLKSLMNLYTAVIAFSVPGAKVDQLEFFRKEDTGEQVDSDQDAPNSEGVRDTSVEAPVSTVDES